MAVDLSWLPHLLYLSLYFNSFSLLQLSLLPSSSSPLIQLPPTWSPLRLSSSSSPIISLLSLLEEFLLKQPIELNGAVDWPDTAWGESLRSKFPSLPEDNAVVCGHSAQRYKDHTDYQPELEGMCVWRERQSMHTLLHVCVRPCVWDSGLTANTSLVDWDLTSASCREAPGDTGW